MAKWGTFMIMAMKFKVRLKQGIYCPTDKLIFSKNSDGHVLFNRHKIIVYQEMNRQPCQGHRV
jgi:hypothetical protein